MAVQARTLGHTVTNCPHHDELKLKAYEYQLLTVSEQDMDHLRLTVRNSRIPKLGAKIPMATYQQPLAFTFQHSRLAPAGGTEANYPSRHSRRDSCNLLGHLPQALQWPLTIALSYLM